MSHVLVIGYGNPLRGDDGVGVRAVQELSGTLNSAAVECLAAHQLTFDLAEAVGRADLVIFIDASCQGVPGAVTCSDVEPGTTAPPQFTHTLTPATLVSLAEGLYGRRVRAVLLSVAGESFDYGQDLSPAVAGALGAVVERVGELIAGEGTAPKRTP